MTRTEILTKFGAFKRLCWAMDALTDFTGCIGKPRDFSGDYFEYRNKLIGLSQPNLTDDFLNELDNAIYDRVSYRIKNKIKFDDDDKWHEDNFNYVREKLAHWIDENEEDMKYPTSLTEEELEEVKKITEFNGKMEAYRYIKKQLPHLGLREVKALYDKYVDSER